MAKKITSSYIRPRTISIRGEFHSFESIDRVRSKWETSLSASGAGCAVSVEVCTGSVEVCTGSVEVGGLCGRVPLLRTVIVDDVSDESAALSSVLPTFFGMRKRSPQCGQTPRLPARCDLTLSLCPFGQ